MGYCRNCIHYYEPERESIFDLTPPRCTYLDREVSGSGSCSHFEAKPVDDYRGGSGCFLTSACAEHLGKPDDCEELTKLRAFRDGYMRESESGRMLIDEYYEVAPKIVREIEKSPNKDEYYSYINSVVNDCIDDIDNGRNIAGLEKYIAMVKSLKDKLLIAPED